MREGTNIEFKREWTDAVKKTMVAFANTDGGLIYLGVDDDGTPVGVDDPDATILRAMQAAANAIRPDITLCTSAQIVEEGAVPLVRVEVQRGTSRPYYLAEKGIRPAGVYVRQGAMTAPATESAILAMIRESANDVFDAERSMNQALTFEEARRAFEAQGIAFDDQHLRTLGFTDEFGTYTNTALLFSDQCPVTTKAAVFEGDTKSVFKDRFEFGGSILRQMREAGEFLNRYNATRSTIADDMRRVDERDYPPEAIREALLNLFVHRDYSVPAPALISVFDQRVEFVNFGGLVPGMSADDLMMGVSLQRNPHVGNVFYRMRLIEAYGTGIPKIIASYSTAEASPAFEVASNSFKATLPALASPAGATDVPAPVAETVVRATPAEAPASPAHLAEERVIAYLREHEAASRAQIESLLGLSRSPAGRLLGALEEAGVIRRIGSGRNTRYVLSR